MRKAITLAVTLIMLAAAGLVPAFAFAAPSHQAKFVIGKASYEADGVTKKMDAVPFIANGRTYVPVRYLALALGVPETGIGWDAKARTVTLAMGDRVVILKVGSDIITVFGGIIANSVTKRMDVAPVIKKGRTYLPARWVAEAFGYEVHWDAGTKTVLVYPPGQVVKPEPKPVGYKIDWNAAKNGTLQPPAGAVAPPDMWGFPAKAVRMEFKVGSRYATVTRPDGSVYMLDLGTSCVVVSDKEGTDWFKSKYPNLYTNSNCVTLSGTVSYVAFYVPFIPVAEAFGVPRENIAWDGQHLAVFGFDGKTDGYIALRAGSKETIRRWVTTDHVVQYFTGNQTGTLDYPLFVKDGVPMLGINSVDNISFILFIGPDVSLPGLVNAYNGPEGGWPYETGVVIVDCKPRA